MRYYHLYMDRQCISQEKHRELLNLTPGRRRGSVRPWMGGAALAACALLAVGVWRFAAVPRSPAASAGQLAADAVIPGIKDTYGPGEVPPEPVNPAQLPLMPAVEYPEAAPLGLDGARMWVRGSFQVELDRGEILKILWNGEDKPEAPWMLFWGGFDLEGRALYRPDGSLAEVYLWGSLEGEEKFSITLAPEGIPFSCYGMEGGAESQVRGVTVSSWRYDGSYSLTFLANGVGVSASFLNCQDSLPADAFLNWCTYEDGGLSLDHLLTADHVPEWREEEFSSLSQARQEEEFAPYLPREDIPGYGEFSGRLTYQEGYEHSLSARWSRGYSDVTITVSLPQGEARRDKTVDVDDPAGYDVRLYEIPWADSVPEEYFDTFHAPVFRAADMSREVVEARACTVEDRGDVDGPRMSFSVLHPEGALVRYSAKGLSVDQMWALVEESLET